MPATIGFWNAQRVGNPNIKTLEGSGRYALVFTYVKDWCTSKYAPDVLILCEISESGAEMAKDLQKAVPNYSADFVSTKSQNCNFLVMIQNGSKMVYSITPVGGSARRYLVVVELANGLKVAGIHATADRGEKAISDITDALNDLAGTDTFLIGDMNIAFGKWPLGNMTDELLNDAKQAGYSPLAAPYLTHRGKTMLDYLWVPFKRKAAAENFIKWTDWDVIDHSPILYTVG